VTSGGNTFNDFPEKQLIKFRGLNSIKANDEHAFFCPKQNFHKNYCEYKQFKH